MIFLPEREWDEDSLFGICSLSFFAGIRTSKHSLRQQQKRWYHITYMSIQTVELQAKPFLKWAGGKGQLIAQLRSRLPAEILKSRKIHKYFEPFVGGGAVFFWLSQEYEIKEAFLYDINPEIVMAYKSVQSKMKALILELQNLEKEYHSSGKALRDKIYYEKRVEYNEYISKRIPNNAVRRTALLIFLNKTCFNGLFRVNSRGLFNVPFGRYERPTICDRENLLAIHEVLKNTHIECADFGKCLENADSKSFVYFDPPYRPISRTASFTGYIKDGFNDSDQRRLKQIFDKLNKIGAKVMLSNSDPKNIDPDDNFFDTLYRQYYIDRLSATRMINCNSTKRGLIKEILITNYAVNK